MLVPFVLGPNKSIDTLNAWAPAKRFLQLYVPISVLSIFEYQVQYIFPDIKMSQKKFATVCIYFLFCNFRQIVSELYIQ